MIREIRWNFHFSQYTIFPTYPENHDTKEGFCFLNRGTKTKLFLAVKIKTISIDAYLIFIKAVMLLLS